MAIDEQLLARNNQANKGMNDSKGDAGSSDVNDFNSQKYQARNNDSEDNGLQDDDSQDIRESLMNKKRLQKNLNRKNSTTSVISKNSAAKQSLSGLLKSAWQNLIPSWGLSLIWINIHIFLSSVLGKDLFCSLGEEWFPKGTPRNLDGAKKSVGLTEKMGVGCLNLGCLFIILAVVVLVSMIVSAISNPLSSIENMIKLLGTLWNVLVS